MNRMRYHGLKRRHPLSSGVMLPGDRGACLSCGQEVDRRYVRHVSVSGVIDRRLEPVPHPRPDGSPCEGGVLGERR